MTYRLCSWLGAFLAVVFTASGVADAQTAGGRSIDPSLAPAPMESTVRGDKPSPEPTQDRLFAGTRFWRLDPGRFEVEAWWDHDFNRDGTNSGLLQLELEIGLWPHIQLDIYQNFNVGPGTFSVEGNQIEMRYSFGRSYNQIPLNPVLYLEYHPRHAAPDRAEVRLLLGGDIGTIGIWAVNAYGEMNIDGYGSSDVRAGTDAEAGVSGALSFAVAPEILRLGAEVKAGVDQHATPVFAPVTELGPNILLHLPGTGLKVTATGFFGLMPQDARVELLVIAGYGF
jgi:hypothetical protein